MHLYELEVFKSDAFLLIKWEDHIHIFLVEKLFAA